jgi:capsular polysaccharide biosynthesis protein
MGEDGKTRDQNKPVNPDEKSDEDMEQPGRSNHPMGVPSYAWCPPAEDEIELADLAAVLFRWKWLIVGLTVVFALLTFAVTSMMTEKYKAVTMLEIGLFSTEDGYETVEAPKAIKNRVGSLAKAIGRQMARDLPVSGEGPAVKLGFSVNKDLKIEVPDEGRVVSLELTAPMESEALAFLSATGERLIGDHNRIFDQHENHLINKIQHNEVSLREIDIQVNKILNHIAELKRQYEKMISEKKNRIALLNHSIQNLESNKKVLKEKINIALLNHSIQNLESNKKILKEKINIALLNHSIQNLESNKKVLKEKIKLLGQEKQDLELRIKEAEVRYDSLIKSKLGAIEQAGSGEAVGLMLFSNEVQHIQSYLTQLRDRLLFKIPENIAELENQIEKIDREIVEIRDQTALEITGLENQIEKIDREIVEIRDQTALEITRLEQLDPELEQKIEESKGQIQSLENQKEKIRLEVNELKNRLENMIRTKVIMAPVFSADPASPNLKLNLALGLTAGFFVSVLLAFMLEFWRRNKQKIRQLSQS